MNFLKNKWFLLVLALVLVALAASFTLRGESKVQYYTSGVTQGNVSDVVQATGTINAVTTVQVGSQVSGTIMQLMADFNSKVKKGELVARIEPSLFQGAVLQAKANLENAKANLASAKANLEKAKAAEVQSKQDYDRTVSLTKAGVMSQQQLDAAKATYDSAVAQVNAMAASVTQAEAQIKQSQAALDVANTNLEHTYIYAPIDGTVIARSVDVGQTVAASLQAPTLFTIAQDLTKMQVYTNTDESDVGMIRPGQKVEFTVDAFPKDKFYGEVVQIRLNATVVQNVVTYNTVIEFDNVGMKLFPGMTAYVNIPVAEAFDVMKVPDGALRFHPDLKPQELEAVLTKYGISQGKGKGRGEAQGASQSQGSGQNGAQASGSQNAEMHNGGQRGQRGQAGANGEGGAQIGARRKPGSGSVIEPAIADPKSLPPPRVDQKQQIATVWKLMPDNKTLEPVQVKLGITDHTMTQVVEVLKGSLKNGDKLVIGESKGSTIAGRPGGPMGGVRH